MVVVAEVELVGMVEEGTVVVAWEAGEMVAVVMERAPGAACMEEVVAALALSLARAVAHKVLGAVVEESRVGVAQGAVAEGAVGTEAPEQAVDQLEAEGLADRMAVVVALGELPKAKWVAQREWGSVGLALQVREEEGMVVVVLVAAAMGVAE